jgi:hypothetical protein
MFLYDKASMELKQVWGEKAIRSDMKRQITKAAAFAMDGAPGEKKSNLFVEMIGAAGYTTFDINVGVCPFQH